MSGLGGMLSAALPAVGAAAGGVLGAAGTMGFGAGVGAAGGAALGAAIANWFNSEEAAKATKEERNRMQDLLQKIQVPDFATKEPGIPEYDVSRIDPEDLKLVRKYVPQVAPYVAESRPDLIKESGAMTQGRDAQIAALKQLRGIAGQTTDPELQAALSRANHSSQDAAQSRQASILDAAQRRGGMSPSALVAAQMIGSSQAMARGADQSQNAAAEAYRNRLQALRDSASLGGNIRSADVSEQSHNADIINSFNQRTAANQQNYGQYAANTQNAGQQYNIGQEQRIADANAAGRTRSLERQQDNSNRYKGITYDAQLGQQNRAVDAKKQQFAGEMAKYGQQVPLSAMRQQEISGTAQRNANVAGAVTDIAGMYGANKTAEADRVTQEAERQKDRDLWRSIYGIKQPQDPYGMPPMGPARG